MITFETIRWKNFLSTGDQWTEIELSETQSTLIVGANGAGKSTLLMHCVLVCSTNLFVRLQRDN